MDKLTNRTKGKQTDVKIDRQTNRNTDRWREKQTVRQIDRKTDKKLQFLSSLFKI